jgi:isopenicillin N synthase-like dioxygenase
VDWAELITLDLSKYEQPGGKEELVKQLEHAVQHVGKLNRTFSAAPGADEEFRTGFFYVKNFNIGQEEVDRQFALGREFYALPLEEKLKYHNADDLARGEYNGYRPAGHRM